MAISVADLAAIGEALGQLGFSSLEIRDIVCAAAGMKVSRLSVADAKKGIIERLLIPCGVKVLPSERKYLRVFDEGKGNWSSRLCGTVPVTSPEGNWLIYLAQDIEIARRAREYDEAQNHEEFGKVLGIPVCCRAFYRKFSSLAFTRQGDLLLHTHNNTLGEPPFNFWTNYATQYFGYSLLSFASCSFSCGAAARVAQTVWSVLNDINREYAAIFLTHHMKSVLYTEYSGVYLLDVIINAFNKINYCVLKSTNVSSPLATAIITGNAMKLRDDGCILIYKNSNELALLRGSDCALCLFQNGNFTSTGDFALPYAPPAADVLLRNRS